MTVSSVLLVQLHYLGDVLLATPAVRAARRAFAGARIDFVAAGPGAEALQGNPYLDHVHRFERSVRGRLSTVRALRAVRYDVVVDFHSQPSTAQLVAATRAPVRIGLVGRGPRNLAYTQLLPRERGPVYMPLQKLRMLAPLGVEPCAAGTWPPGELVPRAQPQVEPDLRLDLALTAEDHAFARAVFEQHRLVDDAPVVAVSPVARHAFKQWGAERWAGVADSLLAEGVHVLLTHGPGEQEQAAAVVTHMRHEPVWRYGHTTIKQLAALYARAALWVGNDGGPKHLAAAAGTPTISVARSRLGSVWSDLRPGSGQLAVEPPPGHDLSTLSVGEVGDAVCAYLTAASRSRPRTPSAS